MTIIGTEDPSSAEIFKRLYTFLNAPLYETDIEVAEMIKYASNSWHAAKITFANEVGMVCKSLNIDSHKVMDIFCKDTKLNISKYYMRPGFAFGGSCLPKDVRAIVHKAKILDVNTPLLNSLMPSNRDQIIRVLNEFIKPLNTKRVAILGLSFKANTDDLRESPMLELAEILIGKGYELSIYDSNVMKAKENSANLSLLEGKLHHINIRLKNDLNSATDSADILIIGNNSEEFVGIDKRYSDKYIIDLARISDKKSTDKYIGICW